MSVCLLVMFVSPAKTAELIELRFGKLTRLGLMGTMYEMGGVEISPRRTI